MPKKAHTEEQQPCSISAFQPYLSDVLVKDFQPQTNRRLFLNCWAKSGCQTTRTDQGRQ
jgi:hypothetical protein